MPRCCCADPTSRRLRSEQSCGSQLWASPPFSPTRPDRKAATSCRPRRPSQLLRYAEIKAAARPVLRREHADAAAVTELVDLVEQIDNVEPHGERLGARRDR